MEAYRSGDIIPLTPYLGFTKVSGHLYTAVALPSGGEAQVPIRLEAE
jgi:hypothetical protein